ncbi:MAG TPA: cytochrome c biogenesis protein CcdA [Candidatus Eisenbacteria bacterium]
MTARAAWFGVGGGRRVRAAAVAALLATALVAPAALAQFGGAEAPAAETLVHATAAPVRVPAGGSAVATIEVTVELGWHINANPPSPDYMIPTEVAIEPEGGVTAGHGEYPVPTPLKVGFEKTPILTFGATFDVRLPLSAGRDAARGARALKGTVHFQACNDQVCLTPASVAFTLPVEVVEPGAAPGPAAGSGFTTAPPAGGARAAAAGNPLAGAFEQGGLAAALALLTIFGTGLALNLTPCVYPMLGVTLSIFGARRAAPPLQVFGLALLYVLGMATMYTTLGVVAALTGGLFGAALQHPLVPVGIGVLMVALALSMFGLYQLQPPPALLARLGGASATSAIGVFLSGLVVGLFAAPCIGPPVVALLALVGARGDAWFGFTVFFTLSLGLGAPYLVLGTFSNLLRSLPRSGEWMVWVERLMGVILLGVGLFYGMLGLAPRLAGWVVPVVLLAGGVYLGFVEKSANARVGFRWLKRAVGGIAVAAGVWIVASTPARGIEFRDGTPEALAAALGRGRPVLVDFSADWCVPCHELERATFTHPSVIQAARGFEAFKVDLTRFDSPESEAWRKQYRIRGVPTVVFLTPDGREVEQARVEGFVPASAFTERLRMVAQAGPRAARE